MKHFNNSMHRLELSGTQVKIWLELVFLLVRLKIIVVRLCCMHIQF